MLKIVALKGCVRCGGGPVGRSFAVGERLRCFECGWRSYSDSVSGDSRKARAASAGCWSGGRIALRYMGDGADRCRKLPVFADMLNNQRTRQVSLSVRCPFCVDSDSRMSCANATNQFWVCEAGHIIKLLKTKRHEFVGWV